MTTTIPREFLAQVRPMESLVVRPWEPTLDPYKLLHLSHQLHKVVSVTSARRSSQWAIWNLRTPRRRRPPGQLPIIPMGKSVACNIKLRWLMIHDSAVVKGARVDTALLVFKGGLGQSHVVMSGDGAVT